jgi:hypothetical protein
MLIWHSYIWCWTTREPVGQDSKYFSFFENESYWVQNLTIHLTVNQRRLDWFGDRLTWDQIGSR